MKADHTRGRQRGKNNFESEAKKFRRILSKDCKENIYTFHT